MYLNYGNDVDITYTPERTVLSCDDRQSESTVTWTVEKRLKLYYVLYGLVAKALSQPVGTHNQAFSQQRTANSVHVCQSKQRVYNEWLIYIQLYITLISAWKKTATVSSFSYVYIGFAYALLFAVISLLYAHSASHMEYRQRNACIRERERTRSVRTLTKTHSMLSVCGWYRENKNACIRLPCQPLRNPFTLLVAFSVGCVECILLPKRHFASLCLFRSIWPFELLRVRWNVIKSKYTRVTSVFKQMERIQSTR